MVWERIWTVLDTASKGWRCSTTGAAPCKRYARGWTVQGSWRGRERLPLDWAWGLRVGGDAVSGRERFWLDGIGGTLAARSNFSIALVVTMPQFRRSVHLSWLLYQEVMFGILSVLRS